MFFQSTFYLSCLLLVAASFEEMPLQDLTMDDQAAESPKINWLPVWQEHEQAASDPSHARSDTEEVGQVDPINKNSSSEEQALSVSIDRAADSCGDSENSGVRRLIREARALLPVHRLTNILANAAQDSEVVNLRRLLRSTEFRGKLAKLRATNEHRLLHAYSCQRLYINYERYIEYVRLFLNVHLNEDSIESKANSRPGIRGLLQDLRAALPVGRLRALYQRLVANDRELATTVNRIRSSQFKQLIKNYRERIEYRDVLILLERAGVPLKGVAELVANALGWQGVDIAAETAILSV